LDVRGIHHPTKTSIIAMPHAEEAKPVVAGCANCLVVDDEPSVRRSLTRMLQAQGFICVEARSGREGLQVLERTGEIPLIISDMRMPELDGMGFLEAVRQKFPDSSVIMLSGISETTTAVDCLHLGAADFLLKPISLGELQARVSRALEKRALVLQNRFYQQHLEQQVQEQAQRIQELFLQGVQMLARAQQAKDAYTRGQ
jgi:putative two-component system response regulator